MKILDEVWIMENNVPTIKIIYGINETVAFKPAKEQYRYYIDTFKTNILYELISPLALSSDYGDKEMLNYNSIIVDGECVFPSKDELIKSLY